MTAWISSTITVRTVCSRSRLRSAVSSRYNDSGVVTRMCGGVRIIAARSAAGVSPVRTAAVMRGASRPSSAAMRRIATRGSARFLWMSALSAFSGDTYSTRTFVGQARTQPLLQQVVQRDEERRERLAGSGGRRDQGMGSAADRVPSSNLNVGQGHRASPKPALNRRMKRAEERSRARLNRIVRFH
jgi:hypothetical protein